MLSDERLNKLKSVGFVEDYSDQNWQTNFKLLRGYLNGREMLISTDLVIEGRKIGSWCSTQRAAYAKGTLAKNKISLLNEIKFIWDIKKYKWNSAYGKLKKFHNEQGHSSPSDKFKYEGFGIGSWVSKQRKEQNLLEPWQVSKLDALGFKWK